MTAYLLSDSTTMLRRSLRRMRRYPSLTFFIAAIRSSSCCCSSTSSAGRSGRGSELPAFPWDPAGASSGREAYIAYVIPGIFLMTVAGVGQGTAITVAMDMTAGIVARFRTMAISRAAGPGRTRDRQRHPGCDGARDRGRRRPCSSGFRPTTDPVSWLGALGLLALVAFA
jgi:ABC-2 type transport system permease protein